MGSHHHKHFFKGGGGRGFEVIACYPTIRISFTCKSIWVVFVYSRTGEPWLLSFSFHIYCLDLHVSVQVFGAIEGLANLNRYLSFFMSITLIIFFVDFFPTNPDIVTYGGSGFKHYFEFYLTTRDQVLWVVRIKNPGLIYDILNH